MTHQEIVTQLLQIWKSEENIWELPLSNLYSEIVARMGQDALNLTADELKLAVLETRAIFEDDHDRERELVASALDSWEILRSIT